MRAALPPPSQEQVPEPSTHSQNLSFTVISLHLLPAADTQERGTKSILQGANGKEYLAYHVKVTPSPSSSNSLEIKALITLMDYLMNLLFQILDKDVKEKRSQHKQTAIALLFLCLLQLPCWGALRWETQVLSFTSPPASLFQPNLVNKELLTTPHTSLSCGQVSSGASAPPTQPRPWEEKQVKITKL